MEMQIHRFTGIISHYFYPSCKKQKYSIFSINNTRKCSIKIWYNYSPTHYTCVREAFFKETSGNGGSVCCVFKQKGEFPHSERPWYFRLKVGPGIRPGTWDCLAKCYQTTHIFDSNTAHFNCLKVRNRTKRIIVLNYSNITSEISSLIPNIELLDSNASSFYMHLPWNCPINKPQRRIKITKQIELHFCCLSKVFKPHTHKKNVYDYMHKESALINNPNFLDAKLHAAFAKSTESALWNAQYLFLFFKFACIVTCCHLWH